MGDPIETYLFGENNDEFLRVNEYVKSEVAQAFRDDETITVDEALTWEDGTEMRGKEREYGEAVLESFEEYQDIIVIESGKITKGNEYTKIL